MTSRNPQNQPLEQTAATAPAPKKKTAYTVSFVQGIGGKLKGTLKTSSGQLIVVEKGDTLSTGHTVASIGMKEVILEKDGKKEYIPIK